MQLKRFAAAIAGVVVSVMLATASACGTSNYDGSGLDFTFVATVTYAKTYKDNSNQVNAAVTVDHIANITGGAAKWFKRSSSYSLFTDYHGDNNVYIGPKANLDVKGLAYLVGKRVKFSGRIHADARSGQHDASGFGHAADRPVIEKYTPMSNNSKT